MRWKHVLWKRAAIVLLFQVPGCDWFEDVAPAEARLMIEGSAGARVQVISSTRFLAGVSPDGVTRVSILVADTTYPPLPIELTYTIRVEQRFFAEASRLDADVPAIRMRVFVDSGKEFDVSGPLEAGKPFRFVYAFNQRLTPVIEVRF